jgi:ABC-type sugar transport system permease subunit
MRRNWWNAYVLAALLSVLVATAAFVSYRNAAFERRELGRATLAATAVSQGERPMDNVVAAYVVSPASPSAKYEFLRERSVTESDGTQRRLGGNNARPHDKRIYDAANQFDKTGAFVQLVTDTDLVIAAHPAPTGVAIAITTPPTGPERFPWLVVLGLLVMGSLVCAAGTLVGGGARPLGLALGASGLAVPTYLWSGLAMALVLIACSMLVAWADWRGSLRRAGREFRKGGIAYAFLTPTAAAMLVLVGIPFVVGLGLGFYNNNHGEWTFVGLDNFIQILSGDGRSLSDPLNFWFTLGVTVAWTAVNVVLHVSIGVALALILRQKWLKGRHGFRMLLILPWAIPNYITALIWKGMFQFEYGAINSVLSTVGLDKVNWFSEWSTSFASNVATNTWLGFPFMMVVALGALENIPSDMYEAAEVDGASPWQRFQHITIPHLMPAMLPALALGAIWTFNMFNVIYLVSDGRPGGGTDILVTEAYRWAFERGERYGLAAAYATIIFLILILWTIIGSRLTKKDAE